MLDSAKGFEVVGRVLAELARRLVLAELALMYSFAPAFPLDPAETPVLAAAVVLEEDEADGGASLAE